MVFYIKLMSKKLQSGFTLIELLVVIGILGILLAIVLIAINPARQFAQADNTKRASDINTIINAIHQYAADNRGTLPAGMPAKAAPSTSPVAVSIASGSGNADICSAITPTYVSLLPSDPQATNGGIGISDCSSYDTEYSVAVDSNGRVIVSAPNTDVSVTQNGQVISITR